ASRAAERTPLDELAAPLEEAPTLTPPLVRLPAEDAKDAGLPAPLPAVPTADPAPEQDTTEQDATQQPASEATAEDAAATTAEPAATDEEITALTTELRTLLDASEAGIAVEVAPAPPAPEVAVPATPVPEVVPAPPSPEEIAAQLAAWAVSTEGYGNGQIPTDVLCEVSFAPGDLLRCDAAHQFEALNAKYREAFGTDISVTDSYRSFDEQVSMKASRGYFAAVPGTSNHGWGLALDLGGGIQDYGTAQYEWMRANAPAFGFDNPEWARAGGSKNEPWHWEFGDLS
uniref:M15 family metallopeptidase n=1 Tax=Cellulosimicrobium cellulans TaxID=1710 RepID=UPI00084941B7